MTEAGKPRRRRKEPETADDPALAGLALRPPGLNAVEQEAFRKLVDAIAERQLLPGVRLVEEDLAGIFGVSRERIRRILLVLTQHDVVRLEPNRGAYVARPSYAECRDAFESRLLIERHVVRTLAALGPARRKMIVSHLRRHTADEDRAIAAGDRVAEIRLSGEFHLKLAAFAGNRRLLRMLQDIISQMSLALAAHTHAHDLDCSIGEHAGLLDAIAAGEPERAVMLLALHLEHMEAALLHGINEGGDGLASALGGRTEAGD
jgi:DNA-binding GntR family transcriptional regulator